MSLIPCILCGKLHNRKKFCSSKCSVKFFDSKRISKRDKPCQTCGKPVGSRREFCSPECKKNKESSKPKYDCEVCGNQSFNPRFCSIDCRKIGMKAIPVEAICETCGKTFSYYTSVVQKKRFCNITCGTRNYSLDINYFKTPLTFEKEQTLGQICAIGQIIDQDRIDLVSDAKTLDHIKSKLNSEHPYTKYRESFYSLKLCSHDIILDLIDLGLNTDHSKQEMVPYEGAWSGLLLTHRYKYDPTKNLHQFTSKSHKLALAMAEKFNGKIISKTIRDHHTPGLLGIEYLIYWK